ncbi:MAG: sodium:alanine symporter family protein [Bacteroidales bacterium]|nr:sodium:alanine symporter family protein [Bacteroidales bacterium]
MQNINDFLLSIDIYLGGSQVFVFLLLGTGIFFTLYLGFPQFRYFGHATRVITGRYNKEGDKGDATHFQALSTALSGTIGTGNIAGVALAIYLGGPAALFWMLVTAIFGMTLKFVEVLVSHKYREFDEQGKVAGGPMYYMRKRLNIKLRNGKIIKTGYLLGGIFAVSTIFCSFGTGNLPQINSISSAMFSTFGINKMLSGGILAVLLGLIIIGGIKRIVKVTSKLVPAMAILYFIGAVAVLIHNYDNLLPAVGAIFTNVFTGTAAVGGFLGATVKFAVQKGVNRGLFSNEAGQGSAPIAHATARAHEPVSEGMVAILGPFIDTIIICMLTGLTILSSGVWLEKHENQFEPADTIILSGNYDDSNDADREKLSYFLNDEETSDLQRYTGKIIVLGGKIEDDITVINSRSVAEDVMVFNSDASIYSGTLICKSGNIDTRTAGVYLFGKSLLHSAPLTALAFTDSIFGKFGQYLVSFGLLLFAFSTAISWSYYGDRAVTYLWSAKYVTVYRIIYVIGFFFASFTDTTVIWTFSGITIVLMTVPNLLGILILSREVKSTIADYWRDFSDNFPGIKR